MKRYAVIGNPIEHSRSPELYNALFSRYGIDAYFEKRLVLSSELGSIRSLLSDYSGLAVTMPYKRDMLQIVDNVSECARVCKSANIIAIYDSKWKGYNTDGDGLCDAIYSNGFDLTNTNIAIVGRGGAAISAAYALSRRGAAVTLLVRTIAPSSMTLPYKQALLSNGVCANSISQFDVLINATPLGMKGYAPFSYLNFLDSPKLRLVFDMVYLEHTQTQLIREAARRGIIAIDGYEMLKYQAYRAFKLWTGITP